MRFSVEILDSTYTRIETGALDFAPRSWEAAAIGGPSMATINATGADAALWNATGWLGYHVRILNEAGSIVWWGFITSVQVLTSGASVNIALDDMRNRINVDYTYTDNDGAALDDETGWAADVASVTRYGSWMERITLADTTPEIAAQKRDTWLAQTALPVPSIDWHGGDSGLRIDCSGYWSILDNVYYENPAGRVVYDETANVEHMIGWQLNANWSIGFHHKVGGFRIHDLNARFFDITVGTRLDVTGSTSNNRYWTVNGVPASPDNDFVEYITDDCFFADADEIYDNHFGFEVLTAGEMVVVDGTSDDVGHEDNDGYWFIQGFDNPGNMEVSGIGRNILNSAVGQTVTFWQGHSVTIDESPNDENPTASYTNLASRGVRVAQSFQTASAWTVTEIMVQAKKIGTPASGLLVRIYSDVAGVPTAVLAEGTIAAADMRTVLEWVTVTLDTPYTLAAATTYWIAVSGATAGLSCYTVGLNSNPDAQYDGGVCKIQILAGSWETRWDDAVSMPFQVWGLSNTSTQVQAMAKYALPDFNCIVRTASGVAQRFYRDGKSRASSEAQTLIDTGDTDGNRISVQVSHDRNVYIGVEPTLASSDAGLCMHYDVLTGALLRADGGLIEEGALPAGQIVYLDNVETAGTTLANVRRVFVETASYDADNERLSMEPKGRRAPWELL